jgi:hypothetical protein
MEHWKYYSKWSTRNVPIIIITENLRDTSDLVVDQVDIEFEEWLQRLWDYSGNLIVRQKDVDVVVCKQRPSKKIAGNRARQVIAGSIEKTLSAV